MESGFSGTSLPVGSGWGGIYLPVRSGFGGTYFPVGSGFSRTCRKPIKILTADVCPENRNRSGSHTWYSQRVSECIRADLRQPIDNLF